MTEYSISSLRAELFAGQDMPAEEIGSDTNLLQLGLDSIDLMAWFAKLKRQGFELTMLDLYRQPTLAGWCTLLSRSTRSVQQVATRASLPTMADGEAFPLTPVQHAYLVGRSPGQVLGGVSCHVYQEFDGSGLEANQLEEAVRSLHRRHPMLNTAFAQDGTQRWLGKEPLIAVPVLDLRLCTADEREARLDALRDQLSHALMPVEQGRAFAVQLSLLPGGAHRLHINLDLLIADAASYSLLMEDLATLLSVGTLSHQAGAYDFRSYLAEKEMLEHGAHEVARAFWKNRLESLPLAPQLPLATQPEVISRVRITRRGVRLPAARWQGFNDHARACGLTAPMALATCFSILLGRWSGQSNILLNTTLFDRQQLDPAVERIVADFTNVLLLDMKCGEGCFRDLALANQEGFAEGYDHAAYSGVEVLRELKKLHRHPHGAPVVFTSNLGRPLLAETVRPVLGEPGWSVSQTPQVWIDHQALEDEGSVHLQWDSNETLFAPGLIATLFDAYVELVDLLSTSQEAWLHPLPDPWPAAQRETRLRVNATEISLPRELLHTGFLRQAERTPNATALLDGDRKVSYGELRELSLRAAACLEARGVTTGSFVAVSMCRGIGQVVSVLGILCAGAAYVPVSLEQPLARRMQIYDGARIALVLTDAADVGQPDEHEGPVTLSWQEAASHHSLRETTAPISDEGTAYVIYTSGSTGVPKGVQLSHRSAVNTCLDVTRRQGTCAADRLLALSALHFDLSVYDIFGMLGAGGALVLIDEEQRRDPGAWCELIERHGVTIWNSVPALFDMLMTYSEGFGLRSPAMLHTIMLSGDWIGMDLPQRYRSFRKDGHFVAMGGATEAAIWSNSFVVETVLPDWRSIPYGFPLANQSFRAVDELGRDCPDWVPGELWIGGDGVAAGYLNDPRRTAERFVEHEGRRWYKTGDLGCYWPNGTLEFLGRRDRQVKVGGYRIELEEIDAALHKLPGIRSAVTLTQGEREKSLVSFATVDSDAFARTVQSDPNLPESYALFAVKIDRTVSPLTPVSAERMCVFICEHLALHGLDFAASTDDTACVERYGCLSAYRELFLEWLDTLVHHAYLVRGQDGRYARGPAYRTNFNSAVAINNASPIEAILRNHHPMLAGIVRGERRVEELLDDPFWSPESLQHHIPAMRSALASLAQIIREMARRLQRPILLVELGARNGMAAEELMSQLDAGTIKLIALDVSQEMVLRLSARFGGRAEVSARRWDREAVKELRHQADVVLANGVLHRLEDVADGLKDMLTLAAPGALLAVHEVEAADALRLVSVDLFRSSDGSAASSRLREQPAWLDLFRDQEIACDLADRSGVLCRFLLRAPSTARVRDPEALRRELSTKLPAYMVPQRVFLVDMIPLTSNGKIDHKALLSNYVGSTGAALQGASGAVLTEAPETPEEKTLFALWTSLLGTAAPHRHTNFFEAGGDSLLATRLVGELGRAGYEAQLASLFASPTLAAFAATLRRTEVKPRQSLEAEQVDRYEPFDLTEVQEAYLVGRDPAFPLGGVGSHFFMEFSVQALDLGRFEEAWNSLIARHDMLRAVVRQGKQQVLPSVPRLHVDLLRVRTLSSPEADTLRDRLAHEVLDPAVWPVFSVAVIQDGGAVSRVLIGLENLLLDGMSMQVLLAELSQLYLHPQVELPPIEIGFRDYCVREQRRPIPPAAHAYWRGRLKELPSAPQLPLRVEPAKLRHPLFKRLAERMTSTSWSALRAVAATHQLTPAALLLTAYAAVLSAWSEREDLSLNVTLFDRRPVHPHIDRVLGDFTSLLLLAWTPGNTFSDSARILQDRLQQDLVHREVSAIRVMRELTQRNGTSTSFPVVFTCALGYDRQAGPLSQKSWLRPVWGISQTPQVWLDHQVYESDGELVLTWDAVEELFEPHILASMFADYTDLLLRLGSEGRTWDLRLDVLLPRIERAALHCSPGVPQVPDSSRVALRPVGGNVALDGVCRHLCEIFEQTVGRAIQRTQNFFEAGASSLDLVRFQVRLREAGYSSLDITDLFSYPNPAALTECLGKDTALVRQQEPDPARRGQMEQRAARRIKRTSAEGSAET